MLVKSIAEMVKIDQDLRFKCSRERRKLKEEEMSIYNYLIYIIDWVHNSRIKNIIRDNGYPSSKLIGRDGMDKFWLLIQHQDYDLPLQKVCLRRCDFSRKNVAYLTDRIAIGEGKKQIYSTQFSGKFDSKGNPIPKPIKNLSGLDKRRKWAGMEPFEQYMKQIKKLIGNRTK